MAELPLFPLSETVVFPGMTVPLAVFEERYKQLVRISLESEDKRFVVALSQGGGGLADGPPPLAAYGTLVDVLTATENADGSLQVLVHGQERCRLELVRTEQIAQLDGERRPLHFVEDREDPPERDDPNEEQIAAWDTIETFRKYAETFFAFDATELVEQALPEDPYYQASFVCANLRVPDASRQVLLEAPTLSARLQLARKLMLELLEAHEQSPGAG